MNGTLLFNIMAESISRMLRVSKFNDGEAISEETLSTSFN
jgi:hypothetical protein